MRFFFFLQKDLNKFFIVLLFFIGSSVNAQSLMVGSPDKSEDYYRNSQLLGSTDSLVSFCLRPLSHSVLGLKDGSIATLKSDSVRVDILPVRYIQQYNTFAPSGWNDGAMIPARGYQSLFAAGIRANYKKLSVQLNPEYVFADNPPFATFPLNAESKELFGHINYLNYMDAPERFGTTNYNKIFWGQSSVRLNFDKVSLGISTENLWWGPGQRNSLLMSSNAPGFLHFTFNTRKPIVTPIGSFEGQFIAGKLTASGYDSPDEAYVVDGVSYKLPKRNDWRYLNGITINYQPKWVPGLFLGLNRVFQIYSKDLGHGFPDYFPVITPFQKKYLDGEDAIPRDQLASLYLRWVLKESKFEFYFESGWNDSSSDIWDLYESPSHSRAFLFGFTKLFPFKADNSKYIRVNFENTQMQQSADQMVREAGSWYVHGLVRHGYTHQSQVLGAGIGPGGNSQTLDISFWKKQDVVGLQMERYIHNLDYYYRAYNNPDFAYFAYNHKWADLNFNAYAFRRFGDIGVHFQLNATYIRNYQWVYKDNEFNFQPKVSLMYYF